MTEKLQNPFKINELITAVNSLVDSEGSSTPDNLSITQNASSNLQAVGVINQNATTTAIKTWTGTLAEYNAIVSKDNGTLYNITDDASGTMNVYNKAEVDTLLNNKADINLSNVEIPHLISFETDGTQWCKTYSNGWREQFCVYSNIVSLNSFTNAGFTWQLYKPITNFASGHATIGGNAAIIPGDVFSSSTTEVIFWLHNASNGDVSNATITGKFYVEGWI